VIVSRLPGHSETCPNLEQYAAIGTMLADLHRAAQSCPEQLPHQRDTAWCARMAAQIEPCLEEEDAWLLRDEVRHQLRERPLDLPRGVIHADLFRDNVLFVDSRVSGLLDFYFAGVDDLLFDLAVTTNDWCATASGELDTESSAILVDAYDRRRPLLSSERAAWPTMLRAAALRFWVSRLYDRYLPRAGELVLQRDPDACRALLRAHRAVASSDARRAADAAAAPQQPPIS
jgi:homoserine kinase type II